jgi:hypothetical protein
VKSISDRHADPFFTMSELSPPTAAAPRTLSAVWTAALAAFVVLVVGASIIDSLPVGLFFDDGMYVILAKSLATGHGYRWLHLPGAPAATHYPPGYPALLSLVWRMFPSFPANALAFKLTNACLLAAAAAGIVIFASKRLGFSSVGALLVSVVGCLSIPTLVLSTQVMSEVCFLALLVPALLLAERVVDGESTPGAAALLGVCAGALMLVRTHGVAFFLAVAALLLLRRLWPSLVIFAAVALAVVLPWEIWKSAHEGVVPAPLRGSYESYSGWLSRGFHSGGLSLAARTVWNTGRDLYGIMLGIWTAGLPSAARPVLALFVVTLTVAGLARLRRRAPVAALFVVIHVGIVLLWPYTPARFIWGIWPIIVLLAVLGALVVRDWRPVGFGPRIARGVIAAGIVSCTVGYATYTTRGYRGHWWSSIPRGAAVAVRPLIQWTMHNTQPQAVVASNAEVLVYLYTGRSAVPVASFAVDDYFTMPTTEARADALRSILRAYRVDAVAIVGNVALSAAALSMAGQRPPELVLRDSIPNGLIFSSMIR